MKEPIKVNLSYISQNKNINEVWPSFTFLLEVPKIGDLVRVDDSVLFMQGKVIEVIFNGGKEPEKASITLRLCDSFCRWT